MYQHFKAIYNGASPQIQRDILNAPTGKKAMGIGKRIKTCPKWDHTEKLYAMYVILTTKAKQNFKFREVLLNTGNSQLVEDTSNGFWGRGNGFTGSNHLGKMLSQIRGEIRSNKY